MSKLHTYSILKHNILPEEYLLLVKNVSDRIALTRIRLSNHNLMIEKGRHKNISRISDCTCPFCPGQVDYTNLRQKLLDQVKAITIGFYYPPDEQFLFSPVITHLTARYIKLAMDLRAFLLENPRNTI